MAFLRARLDEDEEAARAAAEPESWVQINRDLMPSWSLQWWADPDVVAVVADETSAHPVAITPDGMEERDAEARAAHIARHDPARVLAEVDAKRRILSRYTSAVEDSAEDAEGYYDENRAEDARQLRPVLRLLALPYAGHPGYRPEWAPGA
ncbi:DUF6221 family protein [Kitasatospora sp. A2-31]|uniref:DUF6221 family protein n=1 Tax=Kitasatospora sp. A2-31 TaxID=2916414 RepID=UPI001EE8F34C|nr:DUF6221 family protein [Kitasatospora sp. A2-31]